MGAATLLVMIEQNLAAYFADCPSVADVLRQHVPRDVEALTTHSGAASLRYRGQHLHSSIDPEAEAQSLFADGKARDADLVILLGLGAGHALRALRARSRARVLVYEPSRDLLAFSLRTLNLAGDPNLHPDGVVHDLSMLRVRLPELYGVGDEIALAVPPAYRRAFPAELATLHEELAFFAGQARLSENTYNLRMQFWIDNLIENLPQRTRLASALSLEGRFRGTPAVIVSAGPSLAKNLGALQTLQDRALILSTNTAYRALEQAGIVPDLVVVIEGLDVRLQFEGCTRLRETHGLFAGVANPRLYELPFQGGFIFDDGIPFYQRWLEEHLPPVASWSGGLCVAHGAFSAALAMGCDPIVLVGQDLAHTRGRVYAAGTVFGQMEAVADGERVVFRKAEAKQEIDRRTALHAPGLTPFRGEEARVRVPGYHGGEVESTLAFATFRRWFENAAVLHGGGRRLWNCTEGGARIEGFAQRPLAEAAAELGGPRGVRQVIGEAMRVPAVSRRRLAEATGRAARRLRRVREAARAARGEPGRAGPVERLRALCRSDPLLNGYLRRDMSGFRAAVKATRDLGEVAALEAGLYESIELAADKLERALRAARTRAEAS
jgi:hypothetical protein